MRIFFKCVLIVLIFRLNYVRAKVMIKFCGSSGRLEAVQTIFEFYKNASIQWKYRPILKHFVSEFDLIGDYDDLLDGWTHFCHADENSSYIFQW